MEKIYFDEFNKANVQKVKTDYGYCKKCKNKNILSLMVVEIEHTAHPEPVIEMGFCKKCDSAIMILSDESVVEIEHTAHPEPAGEMAFCKNCDSEILIIYDKSKEKFLLIMAELFKKEHGK